MLILPGRSIFWKGSLETVGVILGCMPAGRWCRGSIVGSGPSLAPDTHLGDTGLINELMGG